MFYRLTAKKKSQFNCSVQILATLYLPLLENKSIVLWDTVTNQLLETVIEISALGSLTFIPEGFICDVELEIGISQ